MFDLIGMFLVGFFSALDLVLFIKLVKIGCEMVKDYKAEEVEDDE